VEEVVIFTISSSYRFVTSVMIKYLNNYVQKKIICLKLPLDFETKSENSIVIFISTSLC